MKCLICDRDFSCARALVCHFRQKHNLSSNEYYDKFLKKENEGICYCGQITYFDDIVLGYRKYCSLKCSANSESVRTKSRNTCNQNYGCNTPSENKEIRQKQTQTFLRKYGVVNPNQLDSIKEKKKQSYINHYGVDNPNKSDIIKKQKIQTCLIKYGVENPSLNSTVQLKQRISAIYRVEKQSFNGEPLMPNIGNMERDCLNELVQYVPYKEIKRNNSDYRYIVGHFPDGDICGLPVFIQYNERHHYLDKQMKIENENTIQTTLNLASIGKIIFNISEFDWIYNKDIVINQFKQLVEELSYVN